MIVHYCKLKDLKHDCVLNENFNKLHKKFCPGPLTFILYKKKNSKISKLVNNNIFPEQFLKAKVTISIKTEFISTISYLILERIEALFLKKPDLKFDNIILGLRFIHMLKEIPELLIEIRKSVKNRVKNSAILNQISKNHYIFIRTK